MTTSTFMVAVLLALVSVTAPADASPITYIVTSVGSGTIGGATFTNAAVTVTLVADTTKVTSGLGPFPFGIPIPGSFMNIGTTTVQIAGIGTALITDPTAAYWSPNVPSFSTVPLFLIARWDNPAGTSTTGVGGVISTKLVGYDLRTSIGPITDQGGLGGNGDPRAIYNTTLGVLNFSASADTATLTAITTESFAKASAITYTVSGNASGTIGGRAFTNALL